MTYTIRHTRGLVVEIVAKDEAEARRKAMEKRWGPATGIYAPKYYGLGLEVLEVKP